jgi:hypothetical protein
MFKLNRFATANPRAVTFVSQEMNLAFFSFLRREKVIQQMIKA